MAEQLQRTKEWFNARVGRVTGSRVPAILGISPFTNKDKVLRLMVREAHGLFEDQKYNAAIEWGKHHEDGAINEFELETGLKVEPAPFVEKDDWAGASPDGYIGENTLIEIKCPYSKRNKEDPDFKTLKEQPHYYAQVMFQMYCTGRRRAFFVQWTPNKMIKEVVYYSHKWADENIPKLKDFHKAYIKALEIPEEYLKDHANEINTDEAYELLIEYDSLNDAVTKYKSELSEVLSKLSKIAGHKDALIHGRSLKRIKKAGLISYSKVVEDLLPDVDLEKYRGKEIEYFRIF